MHLQSHQSDPSSSSTTTTIPTHHSSSSSSSSSSTSVVSIPSPVEPSSLSSLDCCKIKTCSLDITSDSSSLPSTSCLPAALQPLLDTILHHTIGHTSTGFELDHGLDSNSTVTRKDIALDAIPRAFEETNPETTMFDLVQQNLFTLSPSSATTTANALALGHDTSSATNEAKGPEAKEQSENKQLQSASSPSSQKVSPLFDHHQHPHIIYPTTTTSASAARQPCCLSSSSSTPSSSPVSLDTCAANLQLKIELGSDRGTFRDTNGYTRMDLSANPTEAKTSHGTNNEISDLLSVSSIPTCDPSFDAQPRILLGHIISATAAPLQKLRGDNDSDEDDSDSKYNGSSLRVTTAATTIAEAITTARPTTKDDADNVGEPSCASLTATSSAPVVVPFAHIESEKTLRDEPFDEGEEILADIPIAAVTTTAAAAAATTRTTAMETTEGAKREQPLSTGTSTGDRKRMSGSSALDQTLSRKKRGKNQELNCGGTLIYKMSASPKMVPPILQQEHPQHHANLLRRQDLENELSSSTTLPFDPILFFSMWSPSSSSNDSDKAPKIDRNPANTGTHRYYCSGHPQRSRHHQHCYHLYRNKGDRNLYTSTPSSLEAPQSRKRVFSEAITLSRPLKQELKFVDYHPDWVESIKKRKIHQYATRWTSLLSPSPYVKVLTLRDFWDLMETRTDLSWLAEKDMDTDLVGKGTATEDFSQDSSKARTARTSGLVIGRRQSDSAKQKKAKQTVHYPCPSQFLKGLWEEEMMIMRKRQMIPDNVRKPNRSKVFNPRPISLARKSLKATNSPALAFSLTPGIESPKPEFDTEVGDQTGHEPKETTAAMTVQGPGEFEFSLKKKHRAAAIIRSHAITEGSDMAEYKPWKDGTTSPQKGSLQSLKELRCHIMDPWPAEISKARDECTRVLHRMREQLNIVINLQIHLRSMIKTAPTHWSFLLSIRHPGQVSIELLLALYGPNFMNTSNFKAIEQLLWGSHKGAGGSASSLLSSPSSSTTTSTTTSSSTPPPFATETVDQSSPMDTTSIV